MLTTRPALLKRCQPTPGFGEHNSAILSDIQCHAQLQQPIQRKIYNWNKADIEQLRADAATYMGNVYLKKYCPNTNK